MKFTILFIFFLFLAVNAFSAEISGRVLSAINGSPVIGANVTLAGTSWGAATNNQGEFVIRNIPPGNYTLNVDYIGYKLQSIPELTLGKEDIGPLKLLMEEDVYYSSDIVVTGTRTRRLIKDSPVTTEVIHADEISNLGAENVGQVLEERAGIIINQDGVRGGLLSAQLQGLNDDHTLILIDGSPVIGRIAGQLDLSRISVQNIDRIEIVKGAASSLYGSEAVGGVINIITKEPEESFDYAANANIGSYEAKNAKIDLSFARENTSLLTTGETHRADGYDLDPTTANTTADSYVNYSIFGKIKHQVSDVYSLQASGNYFTQRQEGFDGGFRITDTKTWYVTANNDWVLNNLSNFKFRLYHTSYTKDINRENIHVLNIEDLSRAELIYNRVIFNHILTFGTEGSHNTLQSNRLDEGSKAVQNASLYVQDEIFYKWIEFNAGLRVDYHSEFNWNYSPKIGFLIKPDDKFRLRGSLSNGFRAPDFIELYLDLDHSGLTSQPYIAYGNPNLIPETSISINLGLEYHVSAQTVFKLNAFHNTLKNMINSVFLRTSPDGVQYYTYENLASARTQGLEFDGMLRFWDYYRLTAGYSYLETLDLDSGKPFFNRPRHSARIKFDWNYDRPGFSGNLRCRYIGERLYITMQGEEVMAPWYALWFVRLKQRVLTPVSVFFEVNNILDYQNRDYVALPGRLFFVGIEIN